MDRNGYNPSIMQTKKECYISHSTSDLVRHEIFYGNANRKISKENGFWIWLTPYWHNMSNEAIHFNHDLDLKIKQICQKKYEETHTREEFMKLIGKSYLW